MARFIPEHPKKGSTEAYEWAERMRQARQKKARTKHAVREAGQLTEMQFFGPGGSLEVKPKPKRMRNNLYRVCAWCKKDMGQTSPYSDARPTHGICQVCLAKEMKAFPKKNPGARYHADAAKVAGRYRTDGKSNTERALYAGMEIAHQDSAKAARTMKMNPKSFHNIAPSGFRRGEYVGYTEGEAGVWRIKRADKGSIYWRASHPSGSNFIAKSLGEISRKLELHGVKKNPIAVYNPPAPKVVGTIYNKAIEIRAKKTGSDLAGKYKHVFGKNVKILGLDNGDVVIHHTGGKRLWISRKDYERSGGKHE